MTQSRLRLAFTALTFFCALPCLGDEADSTPFLELKSPTGKITNSANGYTQRVQGYQDYQERLDLEITEDVTKTLSDSSALGVRLTPWGWWRNPEAVGGAPKPNKGYFELKEGWIEATTSFVDLRIGNQIVSWGAADQINPTDVWNPRDLYDPFQSTKLPLFMAKAKVHPVSLDNVNLEGIFSPFFRPTRLPAVLPDSPTQINVTDSRWLLPLPSVLSAGGGGLVAPINYVMTQPSYPTTWQAGARLQVQRIGGWDFSASYYNGVELTPRLAFTEQGVSGSSTLPVTITLYPVFFRQQMFGLDGAGSVTIAKHDIGTRFEIAYFKRDNSRAYSAPNNFLSDLLANDYIHGVAGIDYTVPTSVLGTTLYFNAMYVYYEQLGSFPAQPGALIIQGLPDTYPWDSDLVGYIEDRIGSTLKLTANGLFSTKNADAYVSPGIQYNWTDNLKTTLSGDFFLGSAGGFYGQFHDNRRVNLIASYAF